LGSKEEKSIFVWEENALTGITRMAIKHNPMSPKFFQPFIIRPDQQQVSFSSS
jgi:hypothetical protein